MGCILEQNAFVKIRHRSNFKHHLSLPESGWLRLLLKITVRLGLAQVLTTPSSACSLTVRMVVGRGLAAGVASLRTLRGRGRGQGLQRLASLSTSNVRLTTRRTVLRSLNVLLEEVQADALSLDHRGSEATALESNNLQGKPEARKQKSLGTTRMYWAPVVARGKVHLEVLGEEFQCSSHDSPHCASILECLA